MVAAQLFAALQFVLEERYLERYHMQVSETITLIPSDSDGVAAQELAAQQFVLEEQVNEQKQVHVR